MGWVVRGKRDANLHSFPYYSLNNYFMILHDSDPKDQPIPAANQEGDQSANDTAPVEDDGTPVLDEADLEENNLTEDEAENVDWEDETKQGS
jgi:hypothetical protein